MPPHTLHTPTANIGNQARPTEPVASSPIVAARVLPIERDQFYAAANAAQKKPGRLLRELIQSHLAGESKHPARSSRTAKVDHSGCAELERFELRLASFMKAEVKKRAAIEGMSSSEWVASLIQTVLMHEPVLTEKEIEVVSFANRELAAVGRNLNQIARSMNRAELIGVNFTKDEILTLEGIAVLKQKISKLRDKILNLVVARNRAWGAQDDAAS